MKTLLMASAAVACFGASPAFADATPDPYGFAGFALNAVGGGASFPAPVYREVFDCWFHPLGYDSPGTPGPRAIKPYCNNGAGQGNQLGQTFQYYYYLSTGSGLGKTAIKGNNANLHTGVSSSIPYASNALPTLSAVQTTAGYFFSGSDDIWTLSDDTDWHTGGGSSPQSKFGNLIQVPGVAGAVAIVLNGNDGAGGSGGALVQNGTPVSGSTSAINFSRQAVCGIFSGHITKWNNPILTALNGGTPMGSGQITVVHRPDGSGTTFLATNGLNEQCRYVTGTNNEGDSTIVSYAFPWRDRNQSCTDPAPAIAANQVRWPDESFACGAAPAGSVFARNLTTTGTGGLITKVQGTPGSIGYASVDRTRMVNLVDPITANLQNQFDVGTNNTGTPTFVAPTVAATAAAMASVTPNFTSVTRGNPLAWSLQGVVPNPVLAGAYPLAGFSWIEAYQCYQTPSAEAQVAQLIWTLISAPTAPIVEGNGFTQPPVAWQVEIATLLSDNNLRPRNVSEGGSPCSGKAGAI